MAAGGTPVVAGEQRGHQRAGSVCIQHPLVHELCQEGRTQGTNGSALGGHRYPCLPACSPRPGSVLPAPQPGSSLQVVAPGPAGAARQPHSVRYCRAGRARVPPTWCEYTLVSFSHLLLSLKNYIPICFHTSLPSQAHSWRKAACISSCKTRTCPRPWDPGTVPGHLLGTNGALSASGATDCDPCPPDTPGGLSQL